MRWKNSILLSLFSLLICSNMFGQMKKYNYKGKLNGIKNQWHKIYLPDSIFGKTEPGLTDIRIFGISNSNDTIVAPYIIRELSEITSINNVDFSLINQSHNAKGYYYTFELLSDKAINRISLDFNKQNFDWNILLEGSQNQKEWFTLLENYRILSIKNALTDYRFTTVSFTDSHYRFYRLLIKAKKKPGFKKADIALREVTEGQYSDYKIKSFKIENDKRKKQTVIDVVLEMPVSVSSIDIAIKNDFDYYRPVEVRALVDSVKTQKGWHLNFKTLANGTLNSMEQNPLTFNSTILQRLQIIIQNNDNQALTIGKVKVNGYVYQLIARFTESGTYFLTYGNPTAYRPNYDISQFKKSIPDNLVVLKVGNEKEIIKQIPPDRNPLFKNKTWLWIVMALIIGLLGWFSYKMIKDS